MEGREAGVGRVGRVVRSQAEPRYFWGSQENIMEFPNIYDTREELTP